MLCKWKCTNTQYINMETCFHNIIKNKGNYNFFLIIYTSKTNSARKQILIYKLIIVECKRGIVRKNVLHSYL